MHICEKTIQFYVKMLKENAVWDEKFRVKKHVVQAGDCVIEGDYCNYLFKNELFEIHLFSFLDHMNFQRSQLCRCNN